MILYTMYTAENGQVIKTNNVTFETCCEGFADHSMVCSQFLLFG